MNKYLSWSLRGNLSRTCVRSRIVTRVVQVTTLVTLSCSTDSELEHAQHQAASLASAGQGGLNANANGYMVRGISVTPSLFPEGEYEPEWLLSAHEMARLGKTQPNAPAEPAPDVSALYRLPPDEPGTEGSSINDATVEGRGLSIDEVMAENAAEELENVVPDTPSGEYDYITMEDCRTRLGGRLKNRFAFCVVGKGSVFDTFCTTSNPPVCKVVSLETYRITLIGRGRRDTQEMTFQAEIDQWAVVRPYGPVNPASPMTLSVTCEEPPCDPSGPTSRTAAISTWRIDPGFSVTFNTSLAPGDKDNVHFDVDRVNYHAMNSQLERNDADIPRIAEFARVDFRCDNSLLLRRGACLFHKFKEILHYRISDPRVSEVAQHIRFAQQNPSQTQPNWAGNTYVPGIPGATPERPLRRLGKKVEYIQAGIRDGDKENGFAYWTATVNKKNVQCSALKAPWAKTSATQNCDEYPFASTYEGAHYVDLHPNPGSKFSLRYIDGPQNKAAGSDLASWYNREHILAMDSFFVQIDD